MNDLFGTDALAALIENGIPSGAPTWKWRVKTTAKTLYLYSLYARVIIVADEDTERMNFRAYDTPEPLLEELQKLQKKSGVLYVGGKLPTKMVDVQASQAAQAQYIDVQGNYNVVAGGDLYVDGTGAGQQSGPSQRMEFDFAPHRAITLVVNVPPRTKIWCASAHGPMIVCGEVGAFWREESFGEDRMLPLQ